jgi:hypothetical protein
VEAELATLPARRALQLGEASSSAGEQAAEVGNRCRSQDYSGEGGVESRKSEEGQGIADCGMRISDCGLWLVGADGSERLRNGSWQRVESSLRLGEANPSFRRIRSPAFAEPPLLKLRRAIGYGAAGRGPAFAQATARQAEVRSCMHARNVLV